MTNQLRAAVLIVPAAAILMIPVMLNGFPFIFQDSADYLIFTPYYFRSPFYGLWIFFFHLNRFIWGPVIAQALIGSHLLHTLVKIHRVPWVETSFLLLVLLLTAFSTLPYFVGFIMPDIFTSYMFIVMYLIGFHFFDFSTMQRIYLFLLACTSIASHLSHLAMAIGMVVLFIPLAHWSGRSWKNIRQHTMILLPPVLLTICAYLAFNIVVFHSLSLSPAGQTFFLANLIEYGPAREYLHSACPKARYKICVEAERLPKTADTFLWEEGYLDKLGGFPGMASESSTVVLATVADRPWEVAAMSARNFLDSLNTHKPAVELTPSHLPVWTSIFNVLDKKFGPRALAAFRHSAQMEDALPHSTLENIDSIVVPLSFASLVILSLYAVIHGRRDLVAFALFMSCGIFGDALLCGTVSGVHDRYQARVTWLFLMTAFIVASALIADRGIRRPKG
jgi:hypothetical protein